jgi:peptide subunit release factor 1 (eRF1)
MEIFFGTKDEHNKRREEEFLRLSPDERIEAFFAMLHSDFLKEKDGEYVHPNEKKGNFIIKLYD